MITDPDSIELSTLGGWISTNAAGMKKNKYGNIEDIVQNVVMVTPNGTINQIKPLVRSSIGIKTQNLLFGSEGNIGIITKAVVKNWKGLTLGHLETLLLIDMEGKDPDETLEFSEENAEVLVSSSTEFDTWLNEVVFDLDNFRTGSKKPAVHATGAVPKQ